jgi:hypothetical protein
MPLRNNYAKILSGLLPVGVVGASLLLGSTVPSGADEHPISAQPLAADRASVAQRLAAIREAVSAATDSMKKDTDSGDGNLRLAWGNWWNNWGWGRPWGGWGWPNWNNWRNWNNWNNWWRNW